MDSCFGARSLFGGHSSTDTLFSSTQLEVIQDLDLYFIRQIAHSLGGLPQRLIGDHVEVERRKSSVGWPTGFHLGGCPKRGGRSLLERGWCSGRRRLARGVRKFDRSPAAACGPPCEQPAGRAGSACKGAPRTALRGLVILALPATDSSVLMAAIRAKYGTKARDTSDGSFIYQDGLAVVFYC
ncbi:hypothetical protein HPB50_024571 [Hyalomma asiaticum]|uniref:Uncharacterized protein n=1 Tax=Hyalomma asiaticum TaxID=266040 RepID=A0ACB7TQM3_HYAAI|nr:hypothetical protein HPB50_024571 [Hyalomma asiaticum]